MTTPRVISVGIDGSPASSVALRWAAREADRRGASLRVTNAYTMPVYAAGFGAGLATFSTTDLDAIRTSHEQTSDLQVAAIREQYPHLEIDLHVECGGPVATLVENAKGTELLVVGSSGTGSVAALVLGSVAHEAVHRSPCPVALIPESATFNDAGSIVVGTDGSLPSFAAVTWAAEEAAIWHTDMILAHVWDYPYVGPRTGSVEPADLMELDAATVLAADAHAVSANGRGPTKLHPKLLRGAAGEQLVELAGPADILVIGGRGRGALRSALLGSTSNYAIQHATGPVVIVHRPDR